MKVPRVFKQFAVVLLVVAASSAILSGCSGSKASGGTGGKDVVATVNGKEITLSDVDRIINQQTGDQQSKMSTIQQAAARLQVLDNLIQREAVVQRAEKEKVVPNDDEINSAINTQKSQMTAEEWQKFLKDNNLTEEQIREEARKDLAVKKLQDKLYGQITIRDQELTDYYNNNSSIFVNARGVGLADIVADPSENRGGPQDDAIGEAEAAAKSNRLYTRLKAGADFATVARESSEDANGLQRGGDIGFANEDDLRKNGFPPEMIARLFGPMSVGDITEPIHFPDGRWIIFKLTSRNLENKPLKLEDPGVRDQIKNALISQRQQILQEALIRNAMSEATVVNKLAESMLKDPNMLGGLQQASPGGGATPAASATPSASASATPAPLTPASPAASPARPAATAARPTSTAAPKPTGGSHPAGAPSPKQ
ncbi:MAG: SurA N-terminal domain-containing protein [Pyrinomonadaceae bacterium]